MSDETLDEALRAAFADEEIRPELADALVEQAQPPSRGPGWWLAGAALAAAVLALALIPDGSVPESSEPARPEAPVDLAFGPGVDVVQQAEATLTPCFEAQEAREAGSSPLVGLTAVLEEGALVQLTGLDDPEVDPLLADCVRNAAWEWTWPDQDQLTLLVNPTENGLVIWVPDQATEGVQVSLRVVELDEAGVQAAEQTTLWGADGLVVLDEPLDALTGTVTSAPELFVEWGAQGEFYAGSGLPDDGVELTLVPWGALSLERSLRYSFRSGAEEPAKGKAPLFADGPTDLGMLYESEDALLLVTVTVQP